MYFETVYVHNYVCIHMAKKLNHFENYMKLKSLKSPESFDRFQIK